MTASPAIKCPICADDGWVEVWDEDEMQVVANYECPRLSDPGHAPFNATGLLPTLAPVLTDADSSTPKTGPEAS